MHMAHQRKPMKKVKHLPFILSSAMMKSMVSSTKALTGHALGGAGGIEAVATLQAILNQYAPVNAGTTELDENTSVINVVLGQGKQHDIKYAISNSLGFGGHNAVIALKKWEGE